MLCALSMAIIFSLILSFYLTAIVDNQKNLNNQKSFLTAQLMAKMTVSLNKDKTDGEISFNHGKVQYQKTGETMMVIVFLRESGEYRFKLPLIKKSK